MINFDQYKKSEIAYFFAAIAGRRLPKAMKKYEMVATLEQALVPALSVVQQLHERGVEAPLSGSVTLRSGRRVQCKLVLQRPHPKYGHQFRIYFPSVKGKHRNRWYPMRLSEVARLLHRGLRVDDSQYRAQEPPLIGDEYAY